MDNYAKDSGPGAVWLLCSFYHDALRTQIIMNVNNFVIWVHTCFKSETSSLWSHLELAWEH